nr:MAG TPA: hypothetical protein [Caudoviricetes sp.]
MVRGLEFNLIFYLLYKHFINNYLFLNQMLYIAKLYYHH